ncbi:ribokinase [Salinibacterium sp. ZJ450]|uniref:ribokinase n=1 Tax=Salinibacterium sp. ZJ450 TaxID=2708338 RepID=UPI001423AA83|nr:ribokinase [Salinibacterium sp. ZJ450]
MTSRLIVLGSANRDLTVLVPRHPLPDETLLGSRLVTGTGGKGANQALAAARAGIRPLFVAALGTDVAGDELLADLAGGGVDVSGVVRVAEQPTGIALITVSEAGENTIVVVPGANGDLDVTAAAMAVSAASAPGTVLLAQLEIPLEVVQAGAVAVAEAGGRFVLNLSPARAVPAELLGLADPLVVNESEASLLAGQPVSSPESAASVARALLEMSRSVVITLGAAGVVVADADGVRHVDAQRVTVLDTTGAGDAFVGALVARLADGQDLDAAVLAGVAAGADAVQHVGAQPPR